MNTAASDQLKVALEQCEGYCTLGMWEQAANVLDDLPDELRACAEVFTCRLDIHIGVRNWEHALILAESLMSHLPHKAELWFRLACVQAQSGRLEEARESVRECVELEPAIRQSVVDADLLRDIW